MPNLFSRSFGKTPLRLKRTKQLLSFFLAVIMILSVSSGALSAFAEQDLPLTQTLPIGVTEDGHIMADIQKQWVDAYLQENYYDKPGCIMSIIFWDSWTDEVWEYNPDEWMYGVNWHKLPLGMIYAEKLAKGELELDSVVGGITLEYALNTMLQYSSGPAVWSLLSELEDDGTLHCASRMTQFANLPENYYTNEFYHNDYYTARIMYEITKTLYEGGEERFPHVLEYMKEAQPDDFFRRDGHVCYWGVAQQHAASWGDGAGDFLHCTGIIYTTHPFILTIMTQNITDLDIMGGVAGHLTTVAEAMYEKQQALEKTAETETPAEHIVMPVPNAEGLTADTEAAGAQGSDFVGNTSMPGQDPDTAGSSADVTSTSGTQSQNTAQPASGTQSTVPVSPTAEPSIEVQAPVESSEPAQEKLNAFQKNPFLILFILFVILFILVVAAVVAAVIRRKRRRDWRD